MVFNNLRRMNYNNTSYVTFYFDDGTDEYELIIQYTKLIKVFKCLDDRKILVSLDYHPAFNEELVNDYLTRLDEEEGEDIPET